MSDDQNVLIALFQARKERVCTDFIRYGNDSVYSPEYVYAIEHDMFPYFNNTHIPEENIIDPYYDIYRIHHDLMDKIIIFLDEEWLDGKIYSFYELEDHFGRGIRHELICILRYSYLRRGFDKKFWDKIISHAPAEANYLARDLKPSDVYVM